MPRAVVNRMGIQMALRPSVGVGQALDSSLQSGNLGNLTANFLIEINQNLRT
jgi:hypothetical protein